MGESVSTAVQAVLAGLDDVRAWQEPLYRQLHQHPELSHQETRTAALVAERLTRSGWTVHEGVGGTGVVGVLTRGEGPVVLLRADMDGLPVLEDTGLTYASTDTATDRDGNETPVMHACGHDVHITCLLGAAQLLADGDAHWQGTVVALFQPGEEVGDGARRMVEDGLADLIPRPDVAFAQHVLAAPAGWIGTRPGPVYTAADSIKVTVFGSGGHGSMPHATVDPVVLAAAIVMRLQTVVAREVAPSETAVVTVGKLQAGTKSNIIPDEAELQLNVRTYDAVTRSRVLDAITRIVTAECQASGSPRAPEIEYFDQFPLTINDADVTARAHQHLADHFGDRVAQMPPHTASEDFSDIPNAFGTPYTYWGIGGTDPELYEQAARDGRVAQDVPVNHSARFAPVLQPTCDTGTEALVVAALGWLATS